MKFYFAFIIKQFVEIPERVRLIWLLIMWWISVINRPIKIYRACHPAWVDFDYLPNRRYLLVSPHFVSKIIINCYLWYRRLQIWKWPQSKHLSWWKSGGKKPQIQLEILNPISEKNTDVDNLKKEIGKMIKDFFLSFSQQIVRFVFFVYIKESGTFEQNKTQKTEESSYTSPKPFIQWKYGAQQSTLNRKYICDFPDSLIFHNSKSRQFSSVRACACDGDDGFWKTAPANSKST